VGTAQHEVVRPATITIIGAEFFTLRIYPKRHGFPITFEALIWWRSTILSIICRAPQPSIRGKFRDERWLCANVFKILERRRAALCIHDMLKNHPRLLTADWMNLRYRGDHYSGSYSEQQLSSEAEWINRQLAAGLDIFAYFNNDAQGNAVKNAARLKTLLQSQSTDKSTRR